MGDVLFLRVLLGALVGWLDGQQQGALAYVIEENRLLRRQLLGQRLRLTDDDRRRLAVRGQRLGRRVLSDIATIVTTDTILRWHRQLIARKWTYALMAWAQAARVFRLRILASTTSLAAPMKPRRCVETMRDRTM